MKIIKNLSMPFILVIFLLLAACSSRNDPGKTKYIIIESHKENYISVIEKGETKPISITYSGSNSGNADISFYSELGRINVYFQRKFEGQPDLITVSHDNNKTGTISVYELIFDGNSISLKPINKSRK